MQRKRDTLEDAYWLRPSRDARYMPNVQIPVNASMRKGMLEWEKCSGYMWPKKRGSGNLCHVKMG